MEYDDSPILGLPDQPLLTTEQEPEEPKPHRPLSPLPDVTPHREQALTNPSAKDLELIGQALRTGLGVGALALLPDLIDDLRRTKDPDARLKFLNLAFKEGGYGVKEDKGANLPVFHFNFVGSGETVVVTQTQEAPAELGQIEDATYVEAPPPAPAPPSDDEFQSVVNFIEGL